MNPIPEPGNQLNAKVHTTVESTIEQILLPKIRPVFRFNRVTFSLLVSSSLRLSVSVPTVTHPHPLLGGEP